MCQTAMPNKINPRGMVIKNTIKFVGNMMPLPTVAAYISVAQSGINKSISEFQTPTGLPITESASSRVSTNPFFRRMT